MEHTMRWFGPTDPVRLEDIKQAGCTGVVTALHHIPYGKVWERDEIHRRRQIIEAAGLRWSVVESLPVHDDIKRRTGDYRAMTENYIASMRNLAAENIRVVTYNFMPVLDWVRTDHKYAVTDGSTALRFDLVDFAVFDLFLLGRPGAKESYSNQVVEIASKRFEQMDLSSRNALYRCALLGLPGTTEPFTPQEVMLELGKYGDISSDLMRENLVAFIRDIAPAADALGIQLAIHPDDPPFSLLGLPRVASTRADMQFLFESVPNPSNGLCFCTGSFGAHPDNDIPEMLNAFGDRISFLHLRNTKREDEYCFYEVDHLGGDTDMVAVIDGILRIMRERGRAIPMRPDHGHLLDSDTRPDYYPGYSFIGRLKGLAELRGLELGLSQLLPHF